MARFYVLLLLALISISGTGQAEEFPRNEQPMYGNAKPSPEELRTNKAVLDILGQANRMMVSEKAVDIGWRAIADNDLPKAMRRFNQGWLLNKDNGRVYWGFAVVLQIRDNDLAGSINMFERARKLLPNDPALLLDFGRILEGAGRYQDGIMKFKAALAIDENISPAYYGLVRAYLGLKDIERAAHYAKFGKKFGIPLSDQEIEDLQIAAKQHGK